MSKPTPGPWTAGAFHVHSANSVVCDCVLSQNSNLPTEEKIANIWLISAAPDLLAVCEKMEADTWLMLMLLSDDLAGQLRAALAKARGEEE